MTTIVPVVLDLYHGDDVTDYDDVKNAGILGVIHKATEGPTYKDDMYEYRRTHFAAAGIALWGAYHFMRPGDPASQAAFFVETADPDGGTLLALDHEDEAVPLSSAIAFMRAVEARVGRECVLYSGSLLKEQIAKATSDQIEYLSSRRGWLPEYGAKAICPQCWGPLPWLWQYTGDGEGEQPHSVSGMAGAVDLNHFYGTADELAAQWAGDPT